MRMSLMSVLIYGLMSFASLLHADLNLSVGGGENLVFKDQKPFERALAVGYNIDWKDLFVRPEIGYFFDIAGNGQLSSLWAGPLIGFKAPSKFGPELHLAVGPTWLQHPDTVLGGKFEFSLEGGMGMEGDQFYIGLVWKHLSSAGIYQPNRGRDFIMVQLRILQL